MCRLALGAVAITAKRVPKVESIVTGKVLNSPLILEAARAAQAEFTPITDIRSTADYRKRMCGVLVRRALQQVLDQA